MPPKTLPFLLLSLAVLSSPRARTQAADSLNDVPKRIIARTYNSGFALAHDTYNGMGTGSDGRIYYVLCAEPYDVAGQMYRFDPATREIKHLGDLTEICGEKGLKAISCFTWYFNYTVLLYRDNLGEFPFAS